MSQHGNWTPPDTGTPSGDGQPANRGGAPSAHAPAGQGFPAPPGYGPPHPGGPGAPRWTPVYPAPSAPSGHPPTAPPYWGGNRLSGLMPSGPVRPTYREPHPVRFGMVAVGFSLTAIWMLLTGLLGGNASTYAWFSIVAAAIATAVAVALARFGDRGAAVGAAVATALGLGVTVIVVAAKWYAGNWPLW